MTPATSPMVVLIVVIGLLLFSLLGLAATFYLILQHSDGVMIAIISGPTGTALGGMLSILNNTRTVTNGSSQTTTTTQETHPK